MPVVPAIRTAATMSHDSKPDCGRPYREVRLRGFSDRASLEEATAWVDAHGGTAAAEEVSVTEAAGRVLAAPIHATSNLPPFDSANTDGYALRSGETVGAGDYNPLLFSIQTADHPLSPTASALVFAGMPLPKGADTVLPFEASRVNGSTLEVYRAVAEGVGVERKGQQIAAGDTLFDGRKIVLPQNVGLLASAGVERLMVIRRPRVRLVTAGAKPSLNVPTSDADGPMLCALVMRDGGIVESVTSRAEGQAAIRRAIAAPGADVILVAGRTATGVDDEAPLALAEIGQVAIHGIALRPGGSAAMGLVAAVPVLLLPGDPLACFCAYELFAGRLIRRMGGLTPELPYALCEAEVRRKIVSAAGVVDFCQVRFADGGVEPVGSVEAGGLASAARADGFLLIPAPLEGYAPGARVSVYLYEKAPGS